MKIFVLIISVLYGTVAHAQIKYTDLEFQNTEMSDDNGAGCLAYYNGNLFTGKATSSDVYTDYYTFKNGQLNGEYKRYTKDGTLLIRSNYINGREDGIRYNFIQSSRANLFDTVYMNNGLIDSIHKYVNSEFAGLQIYTYYGDSVVSELYQIKDVETPFLAHKSFLRVEEHTNEYFPNPRYFVNYKPNGPELYYNPDGSIKREMPYKYPANFKKKNSPKSYTPANIQEKLDTTGITPHAYFKLYNRDRNSYQLISAHAKSTLGFIGIISDAKGNPVPNLSITLRNVDNLKGHYYNVTSKADGSYGFVIEKPGRYSVVISDKKGGYYHLSVNIHPQAFRKKPLTHYSIQHDVTLIADRGELISVARGGTLDLYEDGTLSRSEDPVNFNSQDITPGMEKLSEKRFIKIITALCNNVDVNGLISLCYDKDHFAQIKSLKGLSDGEIRAFEAQLPQGDTSRQLSNEQYYRLQRSLHAISVISENMRFVSKQDNVNTDINKNNPPFELYELGNFTLKAESDSYSAELEFYLIQTHLGWRIGHISSTIKTSP